MTLPETAVISIVDDDGAVRDGLAFMLGSLGLAVETYDSAQAFLAGCDPARPGCAVVDVRMSGMTGLELIEELNRRGWPLPVIVMTAHGDVPMAVRAMRSGALDFLEKPADGMVLLERINEALRLSVERLAKHAETAAIRARLAALTPREREVAAAVAAGKPNKVIAFELGISAKTVEIHRHNAMEKLGAGSAAELARLLLTVGGASA